MALERAKGFVRARQRSRTALPAFAEPLLPRFEHVGVDHLAVTIDGTWTSRNAAEFREFLVLADPVATWLQRPQSTYNRVKLETLERVERHRADGTTLNRLVISIHGFNGGGKTIKAFVSCNPTRTLAHLVRRYGTATFLRDVSGLHAVEFFRQSEVPPELSLDGNDNWIEDLDQANAALGPDLFSAFLPVFADQLLNLVLHLVSPAPDAAVAQDGTDAVAVDQGTTIRLRGDTARLSVIETYFERHHARAAEVIRTAAQRALRTLDEAEASIHFDVSGMGRVRELFALRSEAANRRQVSVYAKTRRRLRFEVRRRGRGRYASATTHAPTDRLLHIITEERRAAVRAAQWRSVGRLFAETPSPTISDLIDFVSEIASACQRYNQEPRRIFAMLFRDGALMRRADDDPAYIRLVRDLESKGIVERVTIRLRDKRTGIRLVGLAHDYATVFDTAMLAFSRLPEE